MICAWTERSRAEVGSSRRMNSGSSAMARAMARRWRWPPENSCGKREVMVSGRPASRSAALTRSKRSRASRADAVDDQPLLDELAHRHARVERGEGVLEDDLHPRAQVLHLLAAVVLDVLAEEDHAAAGQLADPHQRHAEGGLAGAGLADDAEGLAAPEVERQAVDRLQVVVGAAERAAAAQGEGDADVLALRARSRRRRRRGWRRPWARRRAAAWCRGAAAR